MIAPLNVSPVRWSALACSALLLGALLVVRQRDLPSALRPYPDRTALEAEKLQLAPFGDDVVRALRTEMAQLLQRGVSPDESVPGNWLVDPVPPDAGGANRTRYVSLAPPPVWSDVISLVSRLEDRTDIVSLDIRSQGTTRKRGISRVEIVVPGTPGTTRRPAGATVPGAGRPDQPRTVGPGPSLRLPSADTVRQPSRSRLPARPSFRSVPTLRGGPLFVRHQS